MSRAEWYLLTAALIGLVIWTRGCFKRSISSCALGLFLGVIAAGGYFAVFSLTRTPYLAAGMLAPFLLVLLLVFPRWLASTSGKVLAGCVVFFVGASAFAEYKLVLMANAMLVIEPYRSGMVWRFDEPLLHLKGEPFVLGMPEMIDRMAAGIAGKPKSIRLIFSQQEFPGWQQRLDLRREQDGGNWYHDDQYQMDGWLCPALSKFFPRAPQHIYARAEAKD